MGRYERLVNKFTLRTLYSYRPIILCFSDYEYILSVDHVLERSLGTAIGKFSFSNIMDRYPKLINIFLIMYSYNPMVF